jgi:hypothetical protein
MRPRNLLFSAVAAATLLAVPTTAGAVPDFPRAISSALNLNYSPPCSVCHQYGKTGNGTPIEPFAWSLRARGLTGGHGTLQAALAADESERVDSDGDGTPDTVELANGTDPNSPANDCIIPLGATVDAGQCAPSQASPSLGCTPSDNGSRSGQGGGPGALVLLGMAWTVRRGGRRRR